MDGEPVPCEGTPFRGSGAPEHRSCCRCGGSCAVPNLWGREAGRISCSRGSAWMGFWFRGHCVWA